MSAFRTKTSFITRLAGAAVLSAAAAAAQAAVITFDNNGALNSNFTTDVFAGDTGTQFQQGYAAQNGFAGSDGNFVHFNMFDTANSLRFKSGPVLLNSFTISSQYGGGGAGVSNADNNGRDYTLELYDNNNMLIHSATMLVGARGSWDEVQLDVAGVRTMRILATWSAPNVFDGWWPNIDNIRFNETAQPAQVAEPGALALVLAALAGLAVTRRRRALLG
ncbi:MAG TPA: PEP-CTERM sorting domain-containing protein [Rubrivivax sp.]|jgi:hypothetical protein|nr:PEP-CTERM sorting domain-containing protein [Rubrivivax sp.]